MNIKNLIEKIKDLFRQDSFVWTYNKKRGWVQDYSAL